MESGIYLGSIPCVRPSKIMSAWILFNLQKYSTQHLSKQYVGALTPYMALHIHLLLSFFTEYSYKNSMLYITKTYSLSELRLYRVGLWKHSDNTRPQSQGSFFFQGYFIMQCLSVQNTLALVVEIWLYSRIYLDLLSPRLQLEIRVICH